MMEMGKHPSPFHSIISGSKIINKRIPITDNPDSIGYEGHWVGWLDINKVT